MITITEPYITIAGQTAPVDTPNSGISVRADSCLTRRT